MMTADELQHALGRFCGSETLTLHGLDPRVRMTEGVMFLAQQAKAYWLIDAIVSHQTTNRARSNGFQVWKFRRLPDGYCDLRMTDGNSDDPIITQVITYSDFPLDHIEIWMIRSGNGGGFTMLLPSEY
jgi:hypothetical protein